MTERDHDPEAPQRPVDESIQKSSWGPKSGVNEPTPEFLAENPGIPAGEGTIRLGGGDGLIEPRSHEKPPEEEGVQPTPEGAVEDGLSEAIGAPPVPDYPALAEAVLESVAVYAKSLAPTDAGRRRKLEARALKVIIPALAERLKSL